jgi:hypothetical protein
MLADSAHRKKESGHAAQVKEIKPQNKEKSFLKEPRWNGYRKDAKVAKRKEWDPPQKARRVEKAFQQILRVSDSLRPWRLCERLFSCVASSLFWMTRIAETTAKTC